MGCLCQWELKAPTDRSRSDCVHEQVAKRIANVHFTDAEEKFTRFAKAVFGADTAEGGIKALEEFVKECGFPTKMSQLGSNVEITPEVLRKVADTCNIIKTNPRELDREEIYQILMECM